MQMLHQERDGAWQDRAGASGHGTREGWSLDKSGTYYHDTPLQADAFVVRYHLLPPLKVDLTSLNEGLDTLFHSITVQHSRK